MFTCPSHMRQFFFPTAFIPWIFSYVSGIYFRCQQIMFPTYFFVLKRDQLKIFSKHGYSKQTGLWIRASQSVYHVTHDSEKLSFEGSIHFLSRYWKELRTIRHNRDVAELHGKQPVTDSLFAGAKKRKVRMPCHQRNPDEGWIKVNVDEPLTTKRMKGALVL